MSIEIEDLSTDLQNKINKMYSKPVMVEEQYQYTLSVLARLQKISMLLDDTEEYNECQKMIKGKKREIKELQEVIDMEKKIKERKQLQATIMAKALEL